MEMENDNFLFLVFGFWFLVFGFWDFKFFFPMKISLAFISGIVFFCTYGAFLQNLEKDFIPTLMHTTV